MIAGIGIVATMEGTIVGAPDLAVQTPEIATETETVTVHEIETTTAEETVP
jgi:hypothetical protein